MPVASEPVLEQVRRELGRAGLVLPSEPDIPVRPPRYAKVTQGVKDFGVVDPKDWRELNRQVAPKAGSGGTGGMPGMDGMPGMGGKRDSGGR